ncbi:MAG TPA: DNA polymerase III subunit delta [Solirubrobacteraceae bacterium]|nr:DNA polymerase III subunit delta [Solirubrobacteraceae bacterium]
MPELKPIYLIHGDDHGAVAERRAGLRALAEREGGGASVELLEGELATPAGVAGALAAMTLAVGRRVIIVEGVERWREADVAEQLAPALANMPPDTTLALFAREEARAKVPASLQQLIKRAGGQLVAQMTVKPWELPRWAREQAARLGLSLDAAAANALVAQVGERQQRLLRELEKLALASSPEGEGEGAGAANVSAQDIEDGAARSSEWRAYALADALVGRDAPAATQSYLRLRGQGERLSGLTYLMASRLREALTVALRLQAGESAAEVKRTLRSRAGRAVPARAADRFLADVARSDPDQLRDALATLAELELDTRGGAPLRSSRSPLAGLDEDTLALRAIERIAAPV